MAHVLDTGTNGTGTTSASVPVSGGPAPVAGNLLIMLVEAMTTTPAADPVTTPSGWTKLAVVNSGTATTDCTLTVFGKIAGASESAVALSVPSGDHVTARIATIGGHSVTDVATDIVVGADNSATTGATATALGITVEDGSLVLICATTGRDIAATTNFSAWTNTNLIGVVGSGNVPLENMDTAVATGLGGGIGMAWGACLGTATGNSTVTIASSTDSWCAVHIGIPTDPDYAPGETVVSWTTPVGGHYLMASFKALTAGVPITEVKKAHALTAVNATTLTATWDGGGTATAGNLLVALVVPCQTADISPTWTGSTGNGSGRGAILTKISDGTETGATITVGTTAQYAIALFELDNAQSTTALAFDRQGRNNFTSAATITFGTPGITQVDEWIGAVVGFTTPPTAGSMVWDTAHAFTEYYEDTDSTAASKIVPAVGPTPINASDSATATDTAVVTTGPTVPTIIACDSFQHRVLRTGGTASNWYQAVTDSTVATAPTHNGNEVTYDPTVTRTAYHNCSLKIANNATLGASCSLNEPTAANQYAASFYFKTASATNPTGNITLALFTASNNGTVRLASGGQVGVQVGGGSSVLTTGDYCDGNWHRIDVQYDSSTTAGVMNATVDGGDAIQSTGTITAAPITQMRLGSTTAQSAYDVWFSDVVMCAYADYPLGDHVVLAKFINGSGTHSGGGTFVGSDAGTTNLHTYVDDAWDGTSPNLTQTGEDYVAQTVIAASDYLEFTMAAAAAPLDVVYGANLRALMAALDSTTQNTCECRLVDSAGTALATTGLTDPSISATAHTGFRHAATTAPSGGWSQATLDATKIRWGYSTDVTPNPVLNAAMVEYVGVLAAGGTPVDASDSATASDVAVLTVALPVTDTAAGVDASVLTAVLPATDTAVGTDTAAAPTAVLAAVDSATAADVVTQRFITALDTGTGVDTSQLLAGNLLTANDSATASDVLTGRAIALADSATAADVAAPVDTGLVDGFEDESFQTDAFQTRPSLPGLADITSALPALTQAATATTNIGVFGVETGTAVDTVSGRAITASDSATTSDAVTALAVAVTDTATGADAVVDLDAALSLTDTATVADAAALLVVYPVTEAGSAADVTALAADLTVTDDGEAVDISGKGFTVSDAATGVDSVLTLAKAVTDSATAVDTSELITTIIGAIASTLPSLTQAVSVNVFAVPQNLIAVSVSPNEIDLTWDAFIGAVAYDIERDDVVDEEPPAVIVFDHLTTTYDDVGLNPNTLYAYRVRAVL